MKSEGISKAQGALQAGRFFEALELLAQTAGRRFKGTLDFNVVFDAEKIISLDGRDRPVCDKAGLKSALSVLSAFSKIPKARALTLILKGAVETCAGRWNQALRALDQAQALDPENAWVAMWKFRARCESNFMSGRSFKMQEALKELDRAIALDPRNPHAYAWRARSLKAMSFVSQALEDIDRTILLSPDYVWAKAIRGNLRAELGLVREALADCDDIFSRCPGKAWVWAQRARVRARCSQENAMLEECVSDLDKAIAMEPGNSMYYAWRGEVHRLLGGRAQAQADFRRSAGLKPRYAITLLWMAKVKILEGKFQEALDCLEEIMPEIPGNELAPSYAWQARLWLGHFEEAVGDFYRAAPMLPERMWVPRPKDDAALKRSFQKLIDGHRGHPWAYAWRGKVLSSMRDPDLRGALKDLNEVLKRDAKHAWACLWRAEVLYRLEGASRALPEFKKACRLKRSGQSLGGLGKILLELGQVKQSLPHLKTAIFLNPDDDGLHIARGSALARLGRLDEALESLSSRRVETVQSPEGYYWRAETLRLMGRIPQALESVEQSLRCGKNLTPARLLRARILRESGRLGEALAELSLAKGSGA